MFVASQVARHIAIVPEIRRGKTRRLGLLTQHAQIIQILLQLFLGCLSFDHHPSSMLLYLVPVRLQQYLPISGGFSQFVIDISVLEAVESIVLRAHIVRTCAGKIATVCVMLAWLMGVHVQVVAVAIIKN